MAPSEAVELGGLRSNSLAADNAPPGAALDGVLDVCAGVCYCAACIAAAPGAVCIAVVLVPWTISLFDQLLLRLLSLF